MKGHGKQEETSMTSKSGPSKFVTSKIRVAHNSLSQASNMPPAGPTACTTVPIAPTVGSLGTQSNIESSKIVSTVDLNQELERIHQTLQLLKEKGSINSSVDSNVTSKILAIQEALKSAMPSANQQNVTSSGTNETKLAVQVLNGQVVNCNTTPLAVTSCGTIPTASITQPLTAANLSSSPKIEHDSPVIVHQCEKPSRRVSFDLERSNAVLDAATIASSITQPHQNDHQTSNALQSEIEEVAADMESAATVANGAVTCDRSACSESGSSCHSSRCCCSSYVCSVCSPRGSIENVAQDSIGSAQGSANSIDIASPRMRQCTIPSASNLPPHLCLEMSSKNTQTENQQHGADPNDITLKFMDGNGTELITPLRHNQLPLINGKTEEDDGDHSCCNNDTSLKSSNIDNIDAKKNTNSPKAHRILINLDDKNRFTEEVTV